MGTFSVSMTITGIESGLSETMDAIVDAKALHSIMPSDLLARLGIAPNGYSDAIDLPRGSAEAQLDIPTDGDDLYTDDFCATITVLFGPKGSPPILGRTTLESMFLAVDPDNDRLIPAEIHIPGDAMVELLTAAGRLKPDAKDGTV